MDNTDKQIESMFDMISSLNDSIIDAGGAPIKFNRIKEQTVYEMIKHLAPNGIRFVYKK